ncbi:hypothetical protein [Xanthobacter pseudotagetidis]|uniref:hypothetical protein n=1 Tax=Xanthobacter pseudotagetidis TaxID=3119911 RepID=UPI0037278AA6
MLSAMPPAAVHVSTSRRDGSMTSELPSVDIEGAEASSSGATHARHRLYFSLNKKTSRGNYMTIVPTKIFDFKE